jgi:hypothetical protein
VIGPQGERKPRNACPAESWRAVTDQDDHYEYAISLL